MHERKYMVIGFGGFDSFIRYGQPALRDLGQTSVDNLLCAPVIVKKQ